MRKNNKYELFTEEELKELGKDSREVYMEIDFELVNNLLSDRFNERIIFNGRFINDILDMNTKDCDINIVIGYIDEDYVDKVMDKIQDTDVIVLFIDMNYINFEGHYYYKDKYNIIISNIIEDVNLLEEDNLDYILESLLSYKLVSGVLLPNDEDIQQEDSIEIPESRL